MNEVQKWPFVLSSYINCETVNQIYFLLSSLPIKNKRDMKNPVSVTWYLLAKYNHCHIVGTRTPYLSRPPAPTRSMLLTNRKSARSSDKLCFPTLNGGKGVCVGQRLKTVIVAPYLYLQKSHHTNLYAAFFIDNRLLLTTVFKELHFREFYIKGLLLYAWNCDFNVESTFEIRRELTWNNLYCAL